jgi:twitching motility protein PilI
MDRTAKDGAVVTANGNASDSGRRTRLREFQARLVERMQAAQSGTGVRGSQLGILIGQSRYLLDLREAGEIVSVGSMTHVPLTRDWYLGLSNIRGNLTSVIDLSRFQGLHATAIEPQCRVVAFAASLAFNSGLLVTQVLGLRNVVEMQVQQAGGSKPWILNQYLDKDGQLWAELSLANLVQDQDFLHIGV